MSDFFQGYPRTFIICCVLAECPQFNHLRQQYHFGTTLKDLLNNTSVNDIIAFFKGTHFYTRIESLLYLFYISYKPWF